MHHESAPKILEFFGYDVIKVFISVLSVDNVICTHLSLLSAAIRVNGYLVPRFRCYHSFCQRPQGQTLFVLV
jgi:hypothetical protein